MPAARYWRIVCIAPYAAGGDMELSELQLHGSAGRLDAPGMLACSHAPIAGALADLSDGSAATVCRFAGARVKSSGFWLRWDLGSSQRVEAVRLAGGSDRACYADTFTLQYSADAATWTTLDTWGRCMWPGANQWAAPVSGEPWLDQAQLLLHVDGSFADASPLARAVTVRGTGGGVTFDAAAKFGSSAVRFNGSGYLSVPPFVTTGDFLFDTWMWLDTLPAQPGSVYGNVYGNTPGSHRLNVNADGSLSWYFNVETNIQTGAAVVQTGRWHHLRCTKQAGSPATFSIYVDGALAAQTTASQATLGTLLFDCYIGYANYTGASMFKGLLDETVMAFALPDTGAFTPPSKAYARLYNCEPRPLAVLPVGALQRVVTGTVGPVTLKRMAGPVVVRDMEFGGAGRYPFKVEGLTGSQKARVTLLRARDRLVARETWSAADGTGEFTGLDVGTRFIALAQDPAGLMHPVGADHYPELPGSTP